MARTFKRYTSGLSLFKKILLLKGYPLHAAKRELSTVQTMGADELQHWQQRKAWQMAKFHYDNNSLYNKIVGNVFPNRWEDLPVVTKKDLQQPLQQILTKGVRITDCHVGNTSGSSGTPFFYAKDKMSHAITWAVIADRYSWYGISLAAKQARFYGIPKEWRARQTEVLKDRLMNRIRFSVFDLSDGAMVAFVQRFSKHAFAYVYGYTNALVMFARYLLVNGIVLKDVCPSLRVCISTSETATPEDHQLLQTAFGVKHIREYGISETCLTAFDAPGGDWLLTEETLLTELVADDNSTVSYGTEGRIITTSLYNTAMPMIRYETGDVGIIEGKADKYRVLKELSGRVNDTVILPGGGKAAGLTFYYVSRSILENSGVLKEFIIRQVAVNKFIFDIVADRNLTEEEISLLKEKVALYLGPGLEVDINRVTEINRPPSGKLKHFYSELT